MWRRGAVKMIKLYIGLVLIAEIAAIGMLSLVAGFPVLPFIPILPLTLTAAFLLRYILRNPTYRARRLSPEAIMKYREAPEAEADTPEELSHRIVERADEIHRTLLESPSEIQIEMCAIGYRACVNDMITLTHLVNEEVKTAGPIKRFKLHAFRRRATDSLSGAREAMPPGALRATRQEHQ